VKGTTSTTTHRMRLMTAILSGHLKVRVYDYCVEVTARIPLNAYR